MRNLRARILSLIAAASLVAVDQYLKHLVGARMAPQETRVFLPGLRLRYTLNTGVSFSLLGDSPPAMRVVTILTISIMAIGIVLLLMGRIKPVPASAAAALIIAGGTGNLVDRLMRGYVIDYLEFTFVRFAVFNFADVCITCGVILFSIWIIWDERQKKKSRQAP